MHSIPLFLFRHEMQHFVNNLERYIVNQIIHVSWQEFQQDLTNKVAKGWSFKMILLKLYSFLISQLDQIGCLCYNNQSISYDVVIYLFIYLFFFASDILIVIWVFNLQLTVTHGGGAKG